MTVFPPTTGLSPSARAGNLNSSLCGGGAGEAGRARRRGGSESSSSVESSGSDSGEGTRGFCSEVVARASDAAGSTSALGGTDALSTVSTDGLWPPEEWLDAESDTLPSTTK